MTQYTLIVSNYFSLSDDTNSDSMSDYFPGIWAIKTQKSAMYFAKKYLDKGDSIKVTCYNNPSYFSLANKFIRELGLKQELFPESAPLPKSETGSMPANLNQLKKYLVVGKKVRMVRFRNDEKESRDTFVKKVQSNAVVVDKNGSNSWLEFGKSNDWSFDKDGATYYTYYSNERKPCVRIEYINE